MLTEKETQIALEHFFNDCVVGALIGTKDVELQYINIK